MVLWIAAWWESHTESPQYVDCDGNREGESDTEKKKKMKGQEKNELSRNRGHRVSGGRSAYTLVSPATRQC